MLHLKQPKKSSIVLNLPDIAEPQVKALQRTEDWHKKRLGNWTGSKIKNIMACSPKGAKMSWADDAKVYEFSKGAIKYVYSRAMERKTKRYIETPSSKAMEYGTKIEPFICKIGEGLINQKIKEVDFITHPEIETLGASSDGITEDGKFVIEIKACNNWETHYDRMFDLLDEKSIDFWQVQTEMLVWGVKKCYYLIAEPPHSIWPYIKEEKVFEDFKKECKVDFQIVDASPFHQTALLKRIKIVESTCTKWIQDGGDLNKIFHEQIEQNK
jgi:hypothetical protein